MKKIPLKIIDELRHYRKHNNSLSSFMHEIYRHASTETEQWVNKEDNAYFIVDFYYGNTTEKIVEVPELHDYDQAFMNMLTGRFVQRWDTKGNFRDARFMYYQGRIYQEQTFNPNNPTWIPVRDFYVYYESKFILGDRVDMDEIQFWGGRP